MAIKKQVREVVYKKFNGSCAYCGEYMEYKAMQVDHIIPQRNFRSHILNKWQVPEFLKHLEEKDVNHIDNYFPTCRICNNWKGTYYLEDFRNEIQLQTERLNKNVSGYRFAKRYGMIQEVETTIKFHFEKVGN